MPHKTSQEVIAGLPKDLKIVDLSADFRLRDPEAYAKWYGNPHAALEQQKEAVYGLTEFYRDHEGHLPAPLLRARAHELLGCRGIGQARLEALQVLPELARRYFDQSLPTGATIRSPTDTERFLKARMRHLGHELFCCLFLDNRHRVLRFDELFRGTIDGASVYPREVVKEALAVNLDLAAADQRVRNAVGSSGPARSEERRVGKEGRSRWSPYD